MIDTKEIKAQAKGQWKNILLAFGFTEEQLNGKHGACFACGGKDRARWIANKERYFCNQCSDRQRDGIQSIMEMNSMTFIQAKEALADYLGIEKLNNSEYRDLQKKREAAEKAENSRLKRQFYSAMQYRDFIVLAGDDINPELMSQASDIVKQYETKHPRVSWEKAYQRHKNFISYWGQCVFHGQNSVIQYFKCIKFLESKTSDAALINDAENIILLHESFSEHEFKRGWLEKYFKNYYKTVDTGFY